MDREKNSKIEPSKPSEQSRGPINGRFKFFIDSMSRGKHLLWWSLLFSCFFLVGLVSHYIEESRSLMFTLTPWFLLTFGVLSLVPNLMNRKGKFFLWVLVTYAITFGLEVLGVTTGLIFGNYVYGDTLGLKLLEVPLVIGFNWVLVMAGFCSLLEKQRMNPFFKALLVASAAVIFDFVLEPIAIAFDYWTWDLIFVPLQNYVAWWLIAFLGSLVYFLLKIEVGQRVSTLYVGFQFIFFISLLPIV